MPGQHRGHRQAFALVAIQGLLERRGLGDPQPHPQAHQHQGGTGQEWHPPAPGHELRLVKEMRQQQEHRGRTQEAQRRAQLREHAVPGALARRRVLGGQQHRTAPLPSQAQALAETAQRQQHRRGHADLRMGRQQADQHGGDAHGQQRRHQGGLAPDPVAVVAEQRRAQRPGEERQGEGGQRLQGRGGRLRSREEQLREHQHRGGGVDVEIEELDGGADQAGEQDPAGRRGCAHRRSAGVAVAGRFWQIGTSPGPGLRSFPRQARV